jgi:hypothetical protein
MLLIVYGVTPEALLGNPNLTETKVAEKFLGKDAFNLIDS